MRCDTPKKQFGGPTGSVAGAIISLHALGDSVLAIHPDFTVCTYKLGYARGAFPFHFKAENARVLESNDMSFSSYSAPDADETNELQASNKKRTHLYKASFAIAVGANVRSTGGSSSSDLSHLLMSCGYFDDCVKVHSLGSLQIQRSLASGHRGRVNCLDVGDEGEMMVTGGDDGTCRIWIVDHGALALAITDGFVKSSFGEERAEETKCYHVHTLLGHVTPISCVAICTKLDVVVSGSRGGSICVHNIRSGKFVRSLHIDAVSKEMRESCDGRGIPVRKLATHMDGSFVAHLCDGSLHHISINGKHLCSTQINERLNAMIICPDSESVITGGELGCVKIWSLSDLSLQCTVDAKQNGSIESLAFTPGLPQFLCIGSSNGLMSIVSRISDNQ